MKRNVKSLRFLEKMHKGLASGALLTPWMIWKHRNAYIFEKAQPSVHGLVTKIKEETLLWARAGRGLRLHAS
jgi:hypothetical protein